MFFLPGEWLYKNTRIYRIPLNGSYNKFAEAAFQRSPAKKAFLKISQNTQENTCARVFFNEIAGLNFI